MSGGSLLELIALSMAWLFFLAGLAVNFAVLRRSLRAKEGERVPSGLGFLPGLVGSLAVFFSIPWLARYGVEVPWPWLWILLPLALDPCGLASVALLLLHRVRSK